MAKRLEEHKKTFKRLNDKGKLKEPYRGNSQDNNDTWHSNGSYTKLWLKCIEIMTKSVKRRCTKRQIKRDAKSTIEWRAAAEKQLRSVTRRMKQAFMQATGHAHAAYGKSISQEEKKEKVMEALTTMLKGCLLHDNHSACKIVCGQSCHCAIEKEQEELFNQAGGLAEGEGDWNWDELPTALA